MEIPPLAVMFGSLFGALAACKSSLGWPRNRRGIAYGWLAGAAVGYGVYLYTKRPAHGGDGAEALFSLGVTFVIGLIIGPAVGFTLATILIGSPPKPPKPA